MKPKKVWKKHRPKIKNIKINIRGTNTYLNISYDSKVAPDEYIFTPINIVIAYNSIDIINIIKYLALINSTNI